MALAACENAAWKDSFRHNHKTTEVEVKTGEIHITKANGSRFWDGQRPVETFITRLETITKVVAKQDQAGNSPKYRKYRYRHSTQRGQQGTAGDNRGHTRRKEGKEKRNYLCFLRPDNPADGIRPDQMAE